MTRPALAALLAAAAAHAEDVCASAAARPGAVTMPLGPSAGADRVTLAPDQNHKAVVCYFNSAARASKPGAFVIEMEGLRIDGWVTVGGRETVTVTPPEGLFAYPSDMQSVEDGEGVLFWIVEAMF